jgi:hypothetical protein
MHERRIITNIIDPKARRSQKDTLIVRPRQVIDIYTGSAKGPRRRLRFDYPPKVVPVVASGSIKVIARTTGLTDKQKRFQTHRAFALSPSPLGGWRTSPTTGPSSAKQFPVGSVYRSGLFTTYE